MTLVKGRKTEKRARSVDDEPHNGESSSKKLKHSETI